MEFVNIVSLFNFTDLAKTAIQSAVGAGTALMVTRMITHAMNKRNKKGEEK
jgi:hypothetical protein